MEGVLNNSLSDRDVLDFIESNFFISAVVEFSCPGRFMVGDLLRDFELTAVL
jgi:hypothetical protein